MVQALVELDLETNRILNIVKAKHNLKDKSEAIKFVVVSFVEHENEPELKPEFVKLMEELAQEKMVKVEDFSKRYNI